MIDLKYVERTQMSNHLNVFQGLFNQLSDMEIKFDDKIQDLWLLSTLLDSWETFRMLLSHSAPNGVISMNLANSSVLNEEMRKWS